MEEVQAGRFGTGSRKIWCSDRMVQEVVQRPVSEEVKWEIQVDKQTVSISGVLCHAVRHHS